MIKAALFDLDGTLLNRDESVKGFINGQYDRLNEFLGHIPKENYITRFLELDNRGYVWKDKVYQQLVHEFEITKVTWEELLKDYISEFKQYCVPFSNLIKMLKELKRVDLKLGIITNGKGQFQMDNIQALMIEEYFDIILISEWEGLKKPDPQIFLKALDFLEVLPEQAIFIGDHPINDVKAAQNVGVKGIWKRDLNWEEGNADFTINDLEELPTLIESINKLI
ncbi:HAD family hydrolase [Bacillus sp. FJAT-49736]|uniref:HAD family hydrolase n=1 Tax=Bacillus sp. FJAT-49736 TaxID=2833582 RepID=UPI001BC9C70F|nr:HAD family hydrolase [Bacillus sp. FJAT-49736]MBS4172750.1 HAD family hydrolase [Bacillus sp. FJAT-49736]